MIRKDRDMKKQIHPVDAYFSLVQEVVSTPSPTRNGVSDHFHHTSPHREKEETYFQNLLKFSGD